MKYKRAFLFLGSFSLFLLQLSGWAFATEPQDIIGKDVETLPLFDAHVHYKRAAWSPYPPNVVLSLMDQNGVAMALVSSSPDEGTITLWEYAPKRIIPEMRPYNDQLGPSNWMKGAGVGDLIEKRLRQYPHEGIGEFHLHEVDPNDEPLMKRIVKLAIEKQVPLHVHSDHEPIEYLYNLNPELTIIWAHAGMSEPANVVEDMMSRYPTLYADTSYRETDILTISGELDPEWKRVLEKFADRFMVGSDTWNNDQWEDYDNLITLNRKWLAHLSTDAAKKIAYQNAAQLFDRKIDSGLIGKR